MLTMCECAIVQLVRRIITLHDGIRHLYGQYSHFKRTLCRDEFAKMLSSALNRNDASHLQQDNFIPEEANYQLGSRFHRTTSSFKL